MTSRLRRVVTVSRALGRAESEEQRHSVVVQASSYKCLQRLGRSLCPLSSSMQRCEHTEEATTRSCPRFLVQFDPFRKTPRSTHKQYARDRDATVQCRWHGIDQCSRVEDIVDWPDWHNPHSAKSLQSSEDGILSSPLRHQTKGSGASCPKWNSVG